MTAAVRVDTTAKTLRFIDEEIPCVIGRGGACPADVKREGDGRTPLGVWPIRGVLLRPGRAVLATTPAIPWRWTRACDGWSDDSGDPAYNRPVLLPRSFSHERLQRENEAYDIIVVLGHNDTPPVPGLGSAIFWHIWVQGADGAPKPTEGCVAVSRENMHRLVPMLQPGMTMEIL